MRSGSKSGSRLGVAALLLAGASSCRSPPSPSPPQPTAAPSPEPSAAERPAAREVPVEPPPQARVTSSGVAVQVLAPGDPSAPQPQAGDVLELRYRVWDEAGRLVGASRAGRTERLSTGWLPVGWAEAMYTLHVGAHAHVWVPAALAYAAQPAGPQGDLTIDVELVGLTSMAASAEDVPLVPPPAHALRTASGLSFVILRAGAGTRHAAPDGRVTVHYDGWTADGTRFDSSYARDKPVTFPLTAVISGWQEAVPLMVEGEKTRFWIPEELAYGRSPGKPQGMLIFDIELLRIED